MARNEAQVRFELIDPALEGRGWNRRTDIRVEETAKPIDIVNHQPRRRPSGRTDYVLRRPLTHGTEPVPLAILEAKHEGLPPEHGLQQGKGYRLGQLHHVPFIFSSNGHLFVEYDEATGVTSEPRLLAEFPSPDALVQRLLAVRGLDPQTPEFKLLETPYQQGRDHFWYFQDAAMRAAFEQIIRARQQRKPARAILPIATGGGKTRMAAGMLRRIFDAGFLGKALFVCDRTELRENGLVDFQAAFGNDAAEINTRNPQKNAKVLIATYQTLDHKKRTATKYKVRGDDDSADPDAPAMDVTFFLKHYPPGWFDVIVIDECHRSAWGKWFVILEKNQQAIQIGLTATPRQIKLPEVKTGELAEHIEEDRRLLADNLKYFGEPPYEYTYQQGVADGYLAPCEIEQYDIHHDGELKPERIRGVLRADVAAKKLTDVLTGQKLTPAAVPFISEGATLEARLVMPDRVRAMSAHLFARLLATGDGNPLQKTIVFCASDHHADLVTNELNRLYSAWTKSNLNAVAIVPTELDGSVCSTGFCVLRSNGRVAPEYLFAFVQSDPFVRCLSELVQGALYPAVTDRQVRSQPIPFRDLAEQQKFAARLRGQLAEVERVRAAVEAQLKAAEALPAAFLRAVFSNSATRSWPKKKISDFAKTKSGSTPSRGNSAFFSGTIAWVKTGELIDGPIHDSEEHVSEAALAEGSLPLLPPKTLLIAMYGQGQTRGRTGLLQCKATTNQACFAVLPNEDFDSEYLQFWFRFMYSELRRQTEGRGGNQSNLNGLLLRRLEVPFPETKTQKNISEKLRSEIVSATSLKTMFEEKLAAVEKLPATLLREAFSGRV